MGSLSGDHGSRVAARTSLQIRSSTHGNPESDAGVGEALEQGLAASHRSCIGDSILWD